jgi:hypothetical protein
MKSVFRFLGVGLSVATIAVAGATASYAQDACADVDAKKAVYERFTSNYSGTTVEQRKAALSAAKEYLEKYGNCAEDAQQKEYFTNYIPTAEQQIKKMEADAVVIKKKEEMQALYTRFNTALAAKNWDEVYAAGKEVLAKEQDEKIKLDVTILLGSIGLDESIKNNDKYNVDTVKFAQDAIQKIESGATSTNYGVANKGVGIMYKNAKFADGKSNALGWLNYTIGYIKYNRDKNVKEAIPYLYKATQFTSAPKAFPEIYGMIGQWYLDEIARLEKEREEKLKAANNVDTDETKAIFALQKGYAERASDAFARGYKLVGATPAEKALKDTLYSKTKLAYEIRNGKADGLDAYVASVTAKPMPNPATEVTPVVEAPATTTPTTDTSTSAKPNGTTSNTATKPAQTNGAKSASTAVSKTAPASKSTAKKTPQKK